MRWYVSSLGSEEALHTAHWHGISFNMSGKHMDQVGRGTTAGLGWLLRHLDSVFAASGDAS